MQFPVRPDHGAGVDWEPVMPCQLLTGWHCWHLSEVCLRPEVDLTNRAKE